MRNEETFCSSWQLSIYVSSISSRRVKHLKSGRKGLVPSNYVAKAADKEIFECVLFSSRRLGTSNLKSLKKCITIFINKSIFRWVNLDFSAIDTEKKLRHGKYQSGAFLIRCSSEINNWQNLRLSVKYVLLLIFVFKLSKLQC